MKQFIKDYYDGHLFQLVHWKQLLSGNRFRQVHYSQFGEDIALQKMLTDPHGVYVDVGAFHPMHYSNTYLLHKRGWTGINIDPNEETIRLFDRYRPKDKNIRMGISPVIGEMPYFVYNHQSCNTFSIEQVERNKAKPFLTLLRKEKVACATLQTLLDNHLGKGVNFDLLNIDVEGMDLEVLKTIDWTSSRPRVVVVESEIREGSDLIKHPTYLYLLDKGYELRAWMGASLLFSIK